MAWRAYATSRPACAWGWRYTAAFHEFVVHGRDAAVNPGGAGAKAAAYCRLTSRPCRSGELRLRLTPTDQGKCRLRQRSATLTKCLLFAAARQDEFYADIQRGLDNEDARLVQRQAAGGMIWSKQFYGYEVPRWLVGDPGQPPSPPQREHGRNRDGCT